MARRLIINADDLGYDPAVTKGILKAMRHGVVTSATLMVNTPYSEAAAREARGLSLGLHLNLARHEPLSTAVPADLLEDGSFVEARALDLPAEAVEEETLAQLDRFAELVGRPATHVDVHKHLHQHPNILEGVIQAAKARALPVRSISPEMRARLREERVRTNDHFMGDAGAEAFWTLDRIAERLPYLEHGVTEWMCHPGYAPSEVRSSYAAQREVELATFTDPKVSEWLEARGVDMVGYLPI